MPPAVLVVSLELSTRKTNGVLVLIGTLVGTLTDHTGALLGTVADANVAIPVAAPVHTCSILNLTLGPLHLNLLG
jgi:hypothetical protein